MIRYKWILSWIFTILLASYEMLAQTSSSLQVSSNQYDFKFINVNTTAIKGMLVTGKELAEPINCVFEGDKDGVFSVRFSQSWDQQTGGYITIMFTPKSPVYYSTRLMISSGDKRVEVDLKGAGHKGYFFGLKPEALNFDSVSVNNKVHKPLRIRNEYTAKGFADVIYYSIEGPDAENFRITPKQWIPDKGGDVEVEFIPTQSRSYQAEIVLHSSDTPVSRVILKGIGVVN